MKQLSEYKKAGYKGIDVSLDISLFEDGLIWAKGIEGHENDYHFIYGVGYDDDNSEYNTFDWADIPIDTTPEGEWNWVEWDRVSSFVGLTKEKLIAQPLPLLVYDLVSYYGTENVFGSSYYPFKITSD